MKFQHSAMIALGHAVKANRHLTFAERLQAEEALDVLRRAALGALNMSAPSRKLDDLPPEAPPEGADRAGYDEALAAYDARRRVARAGLMEAGMYLGDPRCDLDDDTKRLLAALIEQAAYDFAARPSHKQATPTAVAQARRARAEVASLASVSARVESLERDFAALKEKLGGA